MAPKTIHLTTDDLQAIRNTAVTVARLSEIVSNIQELTKENYATIRGDDGIVVRMARVEEMMKSISSLPETLNALSDAQIAVKHEMTDAQEQLQRNQADIEKLKQDINALWELQRKAPSITWLVQNRFREIAIVTVLIVGLSVMFTSLLVFPELEAFWDVIFQSLKRYAGL